jgi:hypothetical protein
LAGFPPDAVADLVDNMRVEQAADKEQSCRMIVEIAASP